MRKITTLLILSFLITNLVSAQDRSCGMESHMEELMQDPVFAEQWHENQAQFKAQVIKSSKENLENGVQQRFFEALPSKKARNEPKMEQKATIIEKIRDEPKKQTTRLICSPKH